ncbi:MAG: tetratricopeptide repeat protein [Nitrospiraceae bacterium]
MSAQAAAEKARLLPGSPGPTDAVERSPSARHPLPNLAMEEARQQRWDDAVRLFQQALDSHRVVGSEDSLAATFTQLGKTLLDCGRSVEAERCFNNASRNNFIQARKSGGEAAVMRGTGGSLQGRGITLSAVRCVERLHHLALGTGRVPSAEDKARLARLRAAGS